MASKALKSYYGILEGERRARYLDSKQARVSANLREDLDELWVAHKGALRGDVVSSGGVALLDLKRELAHRMLRRCEFCERRCKTNRASNVTGHCGVAAARISSEFLHMGEEPDLVPSYTIFFSGCTFNCVYCQLGRIRRLTLERRTFVTPDQVARDLEPVDWSAVVASSCSCATAASRSPLRSRAFARAMVADWVARRPSARRYEVMASTCRPACS